LCSVLVVRVFSGSDMVDNRCSESRSELNEVLVVVVARGEDEVRKGICKVGRSLYYHIPLDAGPHGGCFPFGSQT